MITLSSEYQYLGRSNEIKPCGTPYSVPDDPGMGDLPAPPGASDPGYRYYILIYGKSVPDQTTGEHLVYVKMRLACTGNSSFYGYRTEGSAIIDGASALSWINSQVPEAYWGGSPSLTEGGVEYCRWVDLKEGTVAVNTAYAAKEITVSAAWRRQSIQGTPPAWLPDTTPATVEASVLLPETEPAEPEPGPEIEPEPEPELVPAGFHIYADGALVCDSRLEAHDLAGLKITHGLNVGGTAEIIMPLGHPAYNRFTSQKTIVTIYRNGKLRFRGRALYFTENFYGQRTVTCEGELCLLRDTINRPYNYQATPRSCFVTLINQHNAQTDPEKQFKVGSVTVTDANDWIKLYSENAEPTLNTLKKLLDRCGGYIKFTTAPDGSRTIHWLAKLGTRSNQPIEFGENLLDFSSTGANTKSLATGLVPYGAKDETTKKRLTIESANGGKDYILAADAQAVRGTILATVTWDDVTDAVTLLKKAKAHLDTLKVFITSLTLTALDLSLLDRNLDSFTVGDIIPVISAPHGVDSEFQLTQLTEDLINPAKSTITLGKDVESLTGSDVAGDFNSQSALASTAEALRAEYTLEAQQAAAQAGSQVMEQINQVYAPQTSLEQLTASLNQEAAIRAQADQNLQTAINTEANTRAGMMNKVGDVVHIGGGAPISMLGGKIDINGSEINFGKEIKFLNGSGVRIADKDGNFYYVLRVDNANSCVVGNDYTNLYLRGKDAVYLYKTGAVVTSDQRQKNSVEALPAAYMDLLDKITPVRFRYNDRGGKYHVGFTAQDVDAALTGAGLTREDFGGFVDVAGDGSELGLAYDEFIGLLLEKTRRLETRIKAMEERKT